MEDPGAFCKQLKSLPFKFKLKGSDPTPFHLQFGFKQDKDDILELEPKKYINKKIEGYEYTFGSKSNKEWNLPLEKGYI